MTKDKEPGNFLRKVAKFVAHPVTDWAIIDSGTSESRDSDYAKAEIKAMIERKRRNDFVRKRELDMLRRIRREGLNHDSAMALSSPSNLDVESRRDTDMRPDMGVKAKIDAIEQQMVGGPDRPRSATPPAGSPHTAPPSWVHPAEAVTTPAALPPAPTRASPSQHMPSLSLPLEPQADDGRLETSHERVDGSPVTSHHDAELDEAVIAFANADFETCEACLSALIAEGGMRADTADTWLVLLDLHRAVNQPARFEALSEAFARRFGVSPPQWYSLPDRLAQFLGAQDAPGGLAQAMPERHATSAQEAPLPAWVGPAHLDADAVGSLRAEVLQLPNPWVLDWSAVSHMTAQAADALAHQLSQWAQEDLRLSWVGIDRLLALLEEWAPLGDRDADPAFWMLRIEMLRLCNRPDQFDEAAIDYCITYERSPPSWEKTRCHVQVLGEAVNTQHVAITHVGELSTSFAESVQHTDMPTHRFASLELSGQLVGDVSAVLNQLDKRLGNSSVIDLDCSNLLRVDFIAAGDLLNWVLSRVSEGRSITFVNPHRLVAVFFSAMGIMDHAKWRSQPM